MLLLYPDFFIRVSKTVSLLTVTKTSQEGYESLPGSEALLYTGSAFLSIATCAPETHVQNQIHVSGSQVSLLVVRGR